VLQYFRICFVVTEVAERLAAAKLKRAEPERHAAAVRYKNDPDRKAATMLKRAEPGSPDFACFWAATKLKRDSPI